MGRMKKFSLLLITACILFIWSGECRAWAPPKEQNEAEFLNWYEEHKNTDGAVFALSGDLYIRSGSDEQPVILDGTGSITIDCGAYGIIVDESLNINHPGLTVQGENFFLIMVRSGGHLTLEQGTVHYTGSDGVAVQVVNGKLSVPGTGRFHIIGEGNDITGIAYNSFGESVISNLEMTLTGNSTAKGIVTDRLSSLILEHCDITVTSQDGGYGLYSGAAAGFMIRDSRISAFSSDVSNHANSVYTSEGEIRWENSQLIPEPAKERAYTVLETDQIMPVYVQAFDAPSDWQIPDTIPVYVKETKETEERVLKVPVVWDLPEQAFSEQGYCIVKGRFTDQALDGTLLNPDKVIPELTVICVPKERMFLIAYEAVQTAGKSGLRLFVPYPYGADHLEIEYSTDGTSFTTYTNAAGSDMIAGTTAPKNGLYSFYIEVSVGDRVLYLRAVVEGESMFSGTSAVWTIGEEQNEGMPPDADDDNDGDRGGQNSEPSFPEDKENGTPGEKAVSNQSKEAIGAAEEAPYAAEDTQEPSAAGHSGRGQEGRSASGNTDQNNSLDSPASENPQKSVPYISASGSEKTEDTKESNSNAPEKQEKNSVGNLPFVLVLVCLAAVIITGAWCGSKVFSQKK